MAITNKSTRSLTFGEAIAPFRKAGVPASELLPIAPPDADVADSFRHAKVNGSLGKAPGRYLAGPRKWVGLSGDHLKNGLDKRTRTEALDWPTGNVGLVCGSFPAVDCDVGSEGARELIERVVIATFGRVYAERLRGKGPRRLYALRSDPELDPSRHVPNEKWAFRLPDDGDTLHSIDILGHGKQFVAAGVHPSGDAYEWHPDRDLCAMVQDDELEFIERMNIDQLRAAFEKAVRDAGGTVELMTGGGAAGKGTARDYSWDKPTIAPKRLIAAMQKMPNTHAHFPDRESFVAVIAGFKAATGCEADNFEDDMRDWAAGGEPGFGYEGAEFEKIWRSTRLPRVTPDYLPGLLRKRGVRDLDGIAFEDDDAGGSAADVSREISGHKAAEKAAKAAENGPLLARAMGAYVFQHMGTATGAASRNIRQPMRLRAHPERVWSATEWWDGKTPDPNTALFQELHIAYSKKTGLNDFLRDLEKAHPFAFFTREIRHPGYDYGEVVERRDTRGNPDGALNVRQRSQAQNAAAKPRRNLALARADRELFLDFMRRGFGDGQVTEYLLDTLAYKVQTGKRPGHMLVIEGEPEVGKSLFAEMLIALFDGTGPHVRSRIDGAKLMNEAALRFIFGQIEGCRICSVKELPEGSGRATTAALISTVKQMVDAGSGGDYIDIEKKGVDSRSIENHGYIIATTNYENVIPIEERDRRIMPVRFRITQANRPNQEFYVRLGAILADPERLAAIWDYLASRDIRGYRADKPPPVTAEKASAQYRGMTDPVRHMAVAVDTLIQAGRGIVTLADIVPLMNWAGGIEASERGDWDNGGDLYRMGKPVAGVSAGSSTPVHVKALSWLGEKARKRETKLDRGSTRAPTVYALKGSAVPIEDMQWAELSALLGKDRERHPVREGVRAKPYDVRIDDMPPVVDRIAGDDGRDADSADRGNVVSINRRRQA
ncbi:hypothetical protein SAMN02799636_05123 [Methylobacterium sp. 275MFSha3.1]|uniref:DUF5906 domain-containing protein n=1 Tax=Methylobacterium sp. 275MFSha3.1 TaxID=1502746 RepID=UPI0008A78312|nr:DUF5906 domain-containing protein [Methylobacterium sp. 275MFSha3.1]SEI04352.1 hypothetical protein SAMN02799636_05123 [Methylobacterium sp. 275MFSha3.1]